MHVLILDNIMCLLYYTLKSCVIIQLLILKYINQ